MDIDALQVARDQLRYILITDSAPMSLEMRLQLGLIAAQVALAERLPLRTDDTTRPQNVVEADEFVWDDVTVQRFIGRLGPTGLRAIRALVAAGGTATPEQLKRALGAKNLGGMTSNLRRAVHYITKRVPPPLLVEARHEGNSLAEPIREYRFSAGTLPMVVTALEQLDT
ncbi:hypothetical protein D5S18_02065 [Nocardia panacis]|uniref:Uncharacterized protein n=1 Tax=Nocardia panacis TaxID=2340916 RepID=A0A3A4KBC1_9NOCA|nr:hypothetical protein [Nocardia panacis]RJO79157.1 hypothetical protein D5S18_02065 [Nocardia panacis]